MGNPALQKVADPVRNPTAEEVATLARDMQETLEDIGASGLAAPQVMVNLRVVVYRIIPSRIPKGSGLKSIPWTVMINPEITPTTETQTEVWERCLSVGRKYRSGTKPSPGIGFHTMRIRVGPRCYNTNATI